MARPKNHIEWTIYQAAAEFGINERTLNARLTGVKPAYGAKYSTQQIITARFGDMAGAKLRKLNAEADAAQISVEKEKGILVDVAHIDLEMRKINISVKQMIEGWEDISAERKEEILNGIHAIHSALGKRQAEDQRRGDIPQLADLQAAPEA